MNQSNVSGEVYFLFYTKANFPTISPLLNRLLDHRDLSAKVVKGFDYQEFSGVNQCWMPPGNFGTECIEDFLPPSSPEDVRAQVREASTMLESAVRSDPLAVLPGFSKRIAIPSLVEQYFLTARALEHFVSLRTPQFVFLPEDTDYIRGRLAARILSRRGITTAVFYPMFYNLFDSYPLQGQALVDQYFVLDTRVENRLLRRGVPASRIQVVGHPSVDSTSNRLSAAFPIERLLYPLQDSDWEREILTDLLEVLEDFPDLTLEVKPHPESRNLDTENFLSRFKQVRLLSDQPLESLFRKGTCVLGQSSTVLYQAAAAGLPVLPINYSMSPAPIHLPPASGPVVWINNPGQFSTALQKLTNGLGSSDPSAGLDARKADSTSMVLEWLERLFDHSRKR